MASGADAPLREEQRYTPVQRDETHYCCRSPASTPAMTPSLCILEDNQRRTLCVEIVDDGVGVSPEPRSGVGLTSMRERATELGGTWNIARVSPAGTQVLAMLPLSL